MPHFDSFDGLSLYYTDEGDGRAGRPPARLRRRHQRELRAVGHSRPAPRRGIPRRRARRPRPRAVVEADRPRGLRERCDAARRCRALRPPGPRRCARSSATRWAASSPCVSSAATRECRRSCCSASAPWRTTPLYASSDNNSSSRHCRATHRRRPRSSWANSGSMAGLEREPLLADLKARELAARATRAHRCADDRDRGCRRRGRR